MPVQRTRFSGQPWLSADATEAKPKNFSEAIKRPPRDALTTTAVSNTAEIPRKVYEFLDFAECEEESNGENRLHEGREVGVIDNRPHHEIMVAGGK